ncbi:TPA: putative lipid II flippase FtsW [bacterium]|nr:putative lipid II flippase FtsW [bacterium]
MLSNRYKTDFAKFDKYLLIVVGLLLAIGILMVYSASNAYSREQNGDSLYYLKRHLIWCVLGVFLMFFAMIIPNYYFFERLAWLLLGLSAILLVLVYVPVIGVNINGSSRWIKIGGLTFQPVELTKLSIVIYIARFLNRKADDVKSFGHGILPVLLVVSVFLGLIFAQPDLGSVILITLLVFLMLFIGGAKIWHLAAISSVGLIFMIFGIFCANYRIDRLFTFFNLWADPEGKGYHTIQSLYALGYGGIYGTGLGGSIQKLHYLPTPHTDSIFSVIGEELGFIGTTFVIILFMVVVWRGIVISLRTEDRFASLLAIGIACIIGFQAIINIGVATGSLPSKGITLPFISSGGSSLVTCLISIGMLLNISKNGTIGR